MAIDIKIDVSEFREALKEYIKVSRRTLPEIVNKRAVNIAFKSIRHTTKAKKSRINRDLKAKSRIAPKSPLGAILAQKGRKPGLYGDAMAAAVENLKLTRARSIGFVKSGWFWSIKDLQPLARVRRRPPRVNVRGKRRGRAIPARRGLNPTAQIINAVPGAHKMGSGALRRAMLEDALDMRDFTRKRMQQDAKKFNR